MSRKNIARFVEILKVTRTQPMRREDLEDVLGCGRNTVEGYIKELRAHGLLVKTTALSDKTGRAVVAFRLADEWGGKG